MLLLRGLLAEVPLCFISWCQDDRSPRAAEGRLCLHFLERVRCTLDVNIAKWAFRPHPPSSHPTQRSRAKELSRKSMPSALPPVHASRGRAMIVHLLLTSCGQTFPSPLLTLIWLSDVGRTEQGAMQRSPGPHTQRCQVIESLELTSGCLSACVDAKGGRELLSPSAGARPQGALRNRPMCPCFPPESQFPPTIKESPFAGAAAAASPGWLAACSSSLPPPLCFSLI